jgi:hypothetical protein
MPDAEQTLDEKLLKMGPKLLKGGSS